jgi:signal transduction histidine kinase
MTLSARSTSESGLLEGLTSHLQAAKGTGWGAWRGYLMPSIEHEDPRFRKAITRLSTIGLRAIAGFALGGTLIWVTLGSLFVRGSLSGFGVTAVIVFLLIGLATLVLSFWPPAQSRARLLGLTVLATFVILDLLGSVSVDITPGERWAFFSASSIMMMLVAIAALPIRPLQMTAFSAVLTAMYAGTVVNSGFSLWDGGAASIALVFLLLTSITTTGLTMVVYYERAAAFRARRIAQRAFEELRDAQVRVSVSENAASQSRFAAALSHELNTPLGSLTSAFDTVAHAHERERAQPEKRGELESVWEDAIRSGRESAARLHEVVERMKHLVNLDRAEVQVVDLNQIWKDTAALLSGTIERKAEVELALSPLPPVHCRPQQIAAVFSNLLRNAAAAMDQRGHIRVSSSHRGKEVIFEVQDDGRGMPASQVRNLFNPSFQTEGPRVATTNWGLFVCRSIVTEHGGWIEIASKEGIGTTARVVLPAS